MCGLWCVVYVWFGVMVCVWCMWCMLWWCVVYVMYVVLVYMLYVYVVCICVSASMGVAEYVARSSSSGGRFTSVAVYST